MTVIVFATRDRQPIYRFRQHLEATSQAREHVSGEQTKSLQGAVFSTSAGQFSTIGELLDLPNCLYEFDLGGVIRTCDDVLPDLDGVLLRKHFSVADREFYFRDIQQVRDVAIVGRSQGADRICAS